MSILSLNIRGLGRPEKCRAVKNIVNIHKPFLLFLQETKLKHFDYRTLKYLGSSLLTKGVGVDLISSAGGLLSLWDDEVFAVSNCITNDRCIIVSGMLLKIKKEVRFCNVYAANKEEERMGLCQYILNAQISLPGIWVIGGDFNTVLDQNERVGGIGNVGSMRNFKGFIDAARVVDLPLQGMAFTWTNNREVGSWARLDRFLCSPEFLSWFPSIIQKGLSRSLSDHNPVLLGEPREDWGPKPFRFQNGWLECKEKMRAVHDS
ncbi:hypothetical protein Ddye_012828 [Dipteronia dyeriana]|uniref:Endonuclease/exonuclease/phosphatase domain-containing protein n=1 Tax=Dipteronia dyeriana TaxID=168575 RepID=A0AAD9X5A8_9ROSI|nr:hypothetical protein Ddye_012828 [Dipteronia dyeriana]